MTPGEWATICDEVEDLWGRSSKWVPRTTEKVYRKHARFYTAESVSSALQQMFLDSRPHAPSPSELISAAHNSGGAEPQIVAKCSHPKFGISTFHDDGTAHEAICPVCHVEFRFKPSDQVRTVGDLDARRREKADIVDVMP